MRAFTKAQRADILQRLKHNHKYAAVIAYGGSLAKEAALHFASVLQEAGWSVSGPFPNEDIHSEGLQIGVRDPHSPSPSAHLLVDVLVSVGINVALARTPHSLPSPAFDGCLLLLGCCPARFHEIKSPTVVRVEDGDGDGE